MTLLQRIERHMKATGIKPTVLGRGAINDPRLVHDLRNGRDAGERVRARVLAFIDAREGGAAAFTGREAA